MGTLTTQDNEHIATRADWLIGTLVRGIDSEMGRWGDWGKLKIGIRTLLGNLRDLGIENLKLAPNSNAF